MFTSAARFYIVFLFEFSFILYLYTFRIKQTQQNRIKTTYIFTKRREEKKNLCIDLFWTHSEIQVDVRARSAAMRMWKWTTKQKYGELQQNEYRNKKIEKNSITATMKWKLNFFQVNAQNATIWQWECNVNSSEKFNVHLNFKIRENRYIHYSCQWQTQFVYSRSRLCCRRAWAWACEWAILKRIYVVFLILSQSVCVWAFITLLLVATFLRKYVILKIGKWCDLIAAHIIYIFLEFA